MERTPGNIVPVYDNTVSVGVSASIEYAVAILGVKDLIVCGHSACGAMKGLLHPELLDEIPATARWLKYGQPAVELLQRDYPGMGDADRLRILTQLNVVEQMSHLHTHPAVEARFKAGTLGIHGWFYEIHTGRVDAYNTATGKFEPWPENAVTGNLVLGTHFPQLRQAPFWREKLGSYNSAAVTRILVLFLRKRLDGMASVHHQVQYLLRHVAHRH